MKLSQPPVPPLASGIRLSGKTAVVTGANSGLGYASAKQLLGLHISTLILAVRNVSKGESARERLVSETNNLSATIKVLHLDLASCQSVLDFSSTIKRDYPTVNILLQNAGVFIFSFERTVDGHEKNLQVNYLANVLLTHQLLPVLEAAAEQCGAPSRLSWVGSRMHQSTSLAKKQPLGGNESILKHFDDPAKFIRGATYGDTKLFALLFLEDLATRTDPRKVIINNLCPGMVSTDLDSELPLLLRAAARLVKKIMARTPEQGAWLVLNALIVAGEESHGRLLGDTEIFPHTGFIDSAEGQRVRETLWRDTMAYMRQWSPAEAEKLV